MKEKAQRNEKEKNIIVNYMENVNKKKPLLDTITAAEEKSQQTNVHNSIENQRIKSVPENAKM